MEAESDKFFELFRSVRNEIANENGYDLKSAIKETFERWNKWNDGMPEFDGRYLVLIEQEQECKNTWIIQEVADCIFNNWLLKDKQK